VFSGAKNEEPRWAMISTSISALPELLTAEDAKERRGPQVT